MAKKEVYAVVINGTTVATRESAKPLTHACIQLDETNSPVFLLWAGSEAEANKACNDDRMVVPVTVQGATPVDVKKPAVEKQDKKPTAPAKKPVAEKTEKPAPAKKAPAEKAPAKVTAKSGGVKAGKTAELKKQSEDLKKTGAKVVEHTPAKKAPAKPAPVEKKAPATKEVNKEKKSAPVDETKIVLQIKDSSNNNRYRNQKMTIELAEDGSAETHLLDQKGNSVRYTIFVSKFASKIKSLVKNETPFEMIQKDSKHARRITIKKVEIVNFPKM